MSETVDPQVPEVPEPDTSPAEETQEDQERYDGGDVPRTTETETEVDED